MNAKDTCTCTPSMRMGLGMPCLSCRTRINDKLLGRERFNRMQVQVAAFNAATGAERGDKPMIRAGELRARLILEEAFETVEALLGCDSSVVTIKSVLKQFEDSAPICEYPDLVEAVDGGADLLYVTFGMFDALGVNAEPVFDIVHAANMTKVGAPKDANGKTTKPPGFVPPQERIRELLLKLGAKL